MLSRGLQIAANLSDVTITGDLEEIRTIVDNLISNAMKYCRPGIDPAVNIYATNRKKPLRIMVEDNGIGFDEKYLDKIFQPFQRLHGQNEYEGTGMGLAICRKIAQRHGGSITAKSVPGEGSIFIITLPARQPKPDRGASPP